MGASIEWEDGGKQVSEGGWESMEGWEWGEASERASTSNLTSRIVGLRVRVWRR